MATLRHHSFNSMIYGLRKYATFTSKELKQFLISAIIIGFIIGFNDKRDTTSIDAYYIFFMFFSMLAAGFAMLVKMSIQRYFLYRFGYAPQYNYSINSLLIGIVLIFATEGKLWFLAPGATTATMLQAERLGKWRMGFRILDHARGLSFGIIFFTMFTILLKLFETSNSVFLKHMITINLAIAFYSCLPLPECDGLYILYGGYRWYWVMTIMYVISAWILLKLVSNVWIILFGSAAISIIAVIIFFLTYGIKGSKPFSY